MKIFSKLEFRSLYAYLSCACAVMLFFNQANAQQTTVAHYNMGRSGAVTYATSSAVLKDLSGKASGNSHLRYHSYSPANWQRSGRYFAC